MVRRRSVRSVLPLPDSAVLVRALFEVYEHGAVFDRDVLIGDAAYNFAEFGYYGLSLWLAQDPWPLGRILAEKTRRASRVALFAAGDLGGQGLTLVARPGAALRRHRRHCDHRELGQCARHGGQRRRACRPVSGRVLRCEGQ
jgi:hypothetical protein